MFPLRDENPTDRTAVVTLLLIVACVVVFFFVQPSGRTSVLGDEPDSEIAFTVKHAAIPCEVVQGRPLHVDELTDTFGRGDPSACDSTDRSPAGFPNKQVYLAMLFSMFMHGGLLHIAGNMLFFWVFGNNIEDRMGKVAFLVFYLVGGIAATLAHVAVDPNSTVPVVGASGAVAAVMGAYLVLYPRARVHTAIFFGIILFRPITAWIVLGFWFVSQFAIDANADVAWAAHVGGFVFGVLVGLALRATGGRDRRRDREFVPFS